MINEEVLPVVIVDIASKLKDSTVSSWHKEHFAERLENIREYCAKELDNYNRTKRIRK